MLCICACVYMWTLCMQILTEARIGNLRPWNWSYRQLCVSIWLIKTEPLSFARVTRILNLQAIPLYSLVYSVILEFFYASVFCMLIICNAIYLDYNLISFLFPLSSFYTLPNTPLSSPSNSLPLFHWLLLHTYVCI